ncbi:MAG TPA: tRNA lysidine(34) synthetase TilS [Candidatus Polarisedimenticolaceae bacterium]|nr:tRNA lysidine(34) synthetase TilS [Candidatus Polarisedimenticolaceae bacterium]
MRADRVELAFRRAAASLLEDGATVLAAVSGGADSMALLHLLHRLAPRREIRLVVAHLDHALRRGSSADARFVARQAASRGLELRTDRRPVVRRKRESPEEAARRVRRAFLLEAAEEVGAAHVATGHTLDDQAETILLRLARGAGPAALGGMLAAGPGPFVRPLLGIERAELRAWLGRHRVPWREDPSNRSSTFDRNRLRHLVLPVLTEHLNPRAARHLVDAAARVREDAAYLDALAAGILETAARRKDGALLLDAAVLQGDVPVVSRVARLALQAAGADPRRISAKHVAAILALAAAPRGTLDLPGLRAQRSEAGWLKLIPTTMG